MIPLAGLTEAVMWAEPSNHYELAEELFVDIPTLRIRLHHLTSKEVQHIDSELVRRMPWHM
ncbi:hypothetical protein [Nocardia sp. NPDC004711]